MLTMLVLHGVRLLGFAAPGAVASRFLLDLDATREELLD